MQTPLSPLEFARRARRLYADREAVVDGESRWSYAQFFDRCDRWSSALQDLGIMQGERVVYIAPNTHTHLEAYYSIPQIGAVLVPINWRLTPSDFGHLINHSGARIVCAHSAHLGSLDAVRDQLPGVKHFVALEGGADRPGWLDYESLVARAAPAFTAPPMTERDPLTINYTSGTTARPKGVMLTHRNAYLASIGILIHQPMTCADRYLWTLPMFHVNGWAFVWTVTAVGATHLCLRRADPALIFDALARERATFLCAAPTVLINICNSPHTGSVPQGVRVLTAGAPPAAATIERAQAELGWQITHVYGLTETSPFISVCEPRPEHQGLAAHEQSRIKARQGVELVTSGELRVVNEAGNEVPWDGSTQGEIVVRGNAVMEGYFEDPDATSQAIRNGWFHTGDAAVVHPDGYMEIRDRLKDVIISGGENISSVEVEGALLQHPAVQEAAIVGIVDEKWGEVPHAFVVSRTGLSVSEGELRVFLRERLAGFKCPKVIHFIPELPKTATGKVQKYLLRHT